MKNLKIAYTVLIVVTLLLFAGVIATILTIIGK